MDSKTEPASEAKRIDFNDRINKGKSMPNAELITKCNDWIKSLAASGGKSWVLSIPVRYHVDPDMLFTELTTRFKDSLEEITRLKAELENYKGALERCKEVGSVREEINKELKAELERERELRKEAVALLDVLRDDLINIYDESPTGWTIIQIDTFIEKAKN